MKINNLPKAKNPEWIVYYQRFIRSRQSKGGRIHHILPKALGGGDEKENIILLTDREHFIAHMILWRAYRNKSMFYAFHCMLHTKKGNKERLNSKQYEVVRDQSSSYMSLNNPMHRLEVVNKMKQTRLSKFKSGELLPHIPSEREREALSKRMKADNPMKKSEIVSRMVETKKSRVYKKVPMSEESRKRASERMKGKNNPNYGKVYTKEEREVLSRKLKGKKGYVPSEEQSRKGSISKSKYVYETPFGTFLSRKIALEEIQKIKGFKMDVQLFIDYCKNDKLITFYKGTKDHLFFKKEDRGKTTTEMGWNRVNKEKK